MADTWESFYNATRALMSDEPQRQRLVDAFEEIYCGSIDSIPEEAKAEFDEIKRGMNLVQISGEQGTLQSSVDMMDDHQVIRMIECILGVYTTVTRWDERTHQEA